MRDFIYPAIKRTLIVFFIIAIIILICCLPAFSQQSVIVNKDNTHPEITEQAVLPALINGFVVQRDNDENEISWTASREQDVRKYIVEYSVNSIDYQVAGEVLVNNDATYTFRHRLDDNRPLLYRIKMEQLNGRFSYSKAALLDGINTTPVQIYPTIIQGNMVNVNASWPIQRITVYSGAGAQVFAKDVNGQKDYMSVVIPSLGKGLYWMSFTGDGWRSTAKFIIP